MTLRTVRSGLLALFGLAALLVAGMALNSYRSLQADRVALGAGAASVRRAVAALADTRAGMQAYVAVGQSDETWSARVANNLELLNQELETLRKTSVAPGALNDIDGAASAVDTVGTLNEQVGRLLRNGQMSQAADVIFGEAAASVTSASERIGSAWQMESALVDARIGASARRLGLAAGGSAALLGLIAVALLMRASRRQLDVPDTAEATQSVEAALSAGSEPTLDAADPAAEATPPPELRPDRRQATELKAMADICTDLARLTDSDGLPVLLDRAARLIDAPGFIVWVTDSTAAELRPAVAHGYTPLALARLPRIPRAADNATAAAWRDARMQTVTTNGMMPGALVAPLITTSGCIGVLAAEVRHGRESSESVRALTRILAAQLATLVSLPSPASVVADGEVETLTHEAHA